MATDKYERKSIESRELAPQELVIDHFGDGLTQQPRDLICSRFPLLKGSTMDFLSCRVCSDLFWNFKPVGCGLGDSRVILGL